MSRGFFSDSWHRVADIRAGLLPSVRTHAQHYRGEPWQVLRDGLSTRFFRVRPEAWRFVVRLDPSRTIEEVWRICLEEDPDATPGQEEAIQLLAQLHSMGLLYFMNRPDSFRIFARGERHRRRELLARISSFISIRIPLIDPEPFLKKLSPAFRLAVGPAGFFLWLAALGFGAKAAMEHAGEIGRQTDNVLAPGNLGWLYTALLLMKLFHELSHAAFCNRFGGEVHSLGVMFMIFTPLPYMDASESWTFRDKRERMLVGAAGIFADLFTASMAAMAWTHTAPGILHGLAFNLMLIGSVSSLMFNANPLIRFDGYYIFADALEIPNLYTRARGLWLHWAEKFLFGAPHPAAPGAGGGKEAFWLAAFGLASVCYQGVVCVSIVAFVADRWFIGGLLVGGMMFATLVVFPLGKLIRHLAYGQSLAPCRRRAALVAGSMTCALLAVIGLIPAPRGILAPGIVEAESLSMVYAQTAGLLKRVSLRSGERVAKGCVLVELENRELDLDISATKAQVAELTALKLLVLRRSIADLLPVAERLANLEARLKDLESRKNRLSVRAELSGVWVAPVLEERMGVFLREGEVLGTILDPSVCRFTAVISQERASDIFEELRKHSGTALSGKIRLRGEACDALPASEIAVIPWERRELPSAALGWFGGGEIAISSGREDQHRGAAGRTAAEAFFEARARMTPAITRPFFHGQSGVLRIELAPTPLAAQALRALRQVLQKRYRL